MKDLMESIMSIDHNASDKLNQAVKQKEEAIQEIDEKKRRLSKEMEDYANAHLEALDESERSSAQESILEIESAASEEKSRLQAIYDAKKDQWVDSIVAHVLYE